MTNNEAIAMIRNDMKLHHDALSGEYRKALGMAIKALEKCESWTPKEEKEFDHEKKIDDPWIQFKLRPLTEEEKEDHPDQEYILGCLLPNDGQQILVSIDYEGRKKVMIDEFFDDGRECYLHSGYDLGTEAVAWMPKPAPYAGD